MRVPGVDLRELVDRVRVGVAAVRQIVVPVGDAEPGEPHLRHRARPLQRGDAREIAGQRHREQIHLQRADRGIRVVLLGGDRRDHRVVAGRVAHDQIGREARLDLAHRREVGVEALLVGAAELVLDPRVLAADRVEDRLVAGAQLRQHRGIGVQVGEDVGVDRRRIVGGRQRLVAPRGRSSAPSCRPSPPGRRARASGTASARRARRRCADRPTARWPTRPGGAPTPANGPGLSGVPVSMPPMPFWWPSPPPPCWKRPWTITRSPW